MSAPKFTPGALETSVNADSRWDVCRADSGDMVADIEPGPDAQALAHLLAAAPDLYAALQKIDANAAESVEWIRRVARAALRKAEGGAR